MIERAIATLLLSALWQPLAIAAVVFLLLRLTPRASAATRCAMLTAGLFAAVLVPVTTTTLLYFPVTHAAAMAQVPILSGNAPLPKRAVFLVSPQAIVAIVVAWAAIATVLLSRLAISMACLARLRANAAPLPARLRGDLDSPSARVRLCTSDDTAVPIAAGIFDAMIVIPRALLAELTPADLNRIVQHELAHVRRYDAFVLLLQQLAAALFFFSPGMRWIGKSLDVEREVACDDWVLHRSGEPAPYASCLVRLAERTAWPHSALPAPGAFVTRRSMSIRVERILQRARDARLYPAPGPVLAALTLLVVVALGGFSVEPTLAYTLGCNGAVRASWTPTVETIPLPVKVRKAQPPLVSGDVG